MSNFVSDCLGIFFANPDKYLTTGKHSPQVTGHHYTVLER